MASVLVLDDRAVERDLLDVVLSSAGHTVLQSSSAHEALALTRAEQPDLVIADVLMPDMDGYEFARALRDDAATRDTRVILCTATFDEDEVRELARACGVGHVLIKPVEPQEILLAVDAALKWQPMPARIEPPGGFGHEQLRAANAKLIEKVAELERADEVRNLLAAIVESSDDAIIAKTLEGKIVSWNRGAERLYGYTAAEAIGKPIAMLIPPELPNELPAIMRQIKRGEVAHRLETVRIRKDGSPVDVSLTISPIYVENGRLTGAATIARDISVRKQAERELELAHATAVATARAKTEFLANMSHEIRTPLNGVAGMTRLLADTPLDELQREYLDALESSNEALLEVVEEVLDFSKLDAGNVALEVGELDVRATVDEALLAMTARARGKGLEISQHVEPDVPRTVRGDRARLRQILLSLLSNAIKFTASGQVSLYVSIAAEELLRFAVSDTGVGIDEETSASLFAAFAQADPSSTRRYGGTGLGLAICHQLVSLMDGQIGAEDHDGTGATFWFTAKLPAAAPSGEPARSRPDLLGLRALIVSEGEIERIVLERYLRELGLACVSVEPAGAIAELEGASAAGRQFQLAILDFDQPQLNCVDLTCEIRERPALRALRIVMLTDLKRDREAFAGDATVAVLTRPARPSQVRDAIGDVIAAPAGASEPAEALASSPERADAGAVPSDPAAHAGAGEPHPATFADVHSPSAPEGWPVVLLAEDDKANRAVEIALLGRHGLRTVVAHHGREAIYMAREQRFDAILMDCQLPEIDGYEAARRIHEEERPHHTPIIAVTAHALPGDRERCLGAGMDDYIAKPVRPDVLYDVLDRWLPGAPGAAPETAPSQGDELVPGRGGGVEPAQHGVLEPNGNGRPGPGPELIDETILAELKDALTQEMREVLLRTFEESLPERLAEIAAAARSGNHAELQRVAHTLKGASASLGAAGLSRSAQQLEQLGADPHTTIGQELLDELDATATATCPALRRQLL